MLKIITISALMLGCLHLYSMEQPQIETKIAIILQQTNALAHVMASTKDSSPEQWLTLIKNCGKLEIALENNLIRNEKEKLDIRLSIENLNMAFKTHLQIQQKTAALIPILAFVGALEKAQEVQNKFP